MRRMVLNLSCTFLIVLSKLGKMEDPIGHTTDPDMDNSVRQASLPRECKRNTVLSLMSMLGDYIGF